MKMNQQGTPGTQKSTKTSQKIVRPLLGLLVALLIGSAVGCTEAPSDNTASTKSTHKTTKTTGQTSQTTKKTGANTSHWATVTHVADGDTLTLDGGEKVRLVGVNTPETVKPGTPVQPYGKEASNFTKSQLEGKKVFVETDVQPTDRYGRTLAYVFLQQPQSDADVEKYMYNVILLREGYAQLMTIPPNVKYTDLFTKIQHQAHEQNKGLWALGIYKDSAKSTNDIYLPGKSPKGK